jgi:hypothetical protein
MKKFLVVEDKRTKPSSHRSWLVFCAETGHWVTCHPTEYPEYSVCLSFGLNPYVPFYEAPIAFYRPDEDTPYLIITSPKTIDDHDGPELTPHQMLRVFGSEIIQLDAHSDRFGGEVIQLHPRSAGSRSR